MNVNRNDVVDRRFAELPASLAILFVLVVQCGAQSKDQSGTERKAPSKDGIIACRFSALGMYVDIEVKDQRENAVPSLNMKNFVVYEDGVQQEIIAMSRIGERSNVTYSLYYEPTNQAFDAKRREVRVEARTSDGRKLRIHSRLSPDPANELSFKFSVYPQSYSIQELPRNK
jgi:hypothetical protein